MAKSSEEQSLEVQELCLSNRDGLSKARVSAGLITFASSGVPFNIFCFSLRRQMCEQIVQTLFSHAQSPFVAPPPVLQSTEKGSEEKLNVITPSTILGNSHIAGTLGKSNQTIEQYEPYICDTLKRTIKM